MNGTGAISSLQTCFVICLALAIAFFVISVIMFFAFNIRLIFNIRTGRAKKKTVEEMQKANSETGRLRANGKTLTSKLDKQSKASVNQFSAYESNNNNYTPQGVVMSYDGSERTMPLGTQPAYTVVSPSVSKNMNIQAPPPPPPIQSQASVQIQKPVVDQQVSSSPQPEVYAETSLLNEEPIEETSLLSNVEETSLLSENNEPFRIIEKIEYIHTEEIIC